jgi:hypothetical protein
MMKNQILAERDFENIMQVFDSIPSQLQDANSIIQISLMPKYKIKNKEVTKLREEFL